MQHFLKSGAEKGHLIDKSSPIRELEVLPDSDMAHTAVIKDPPHSSDVSFNTLPCYYSSMEELPYTSKINSTTDNDEFKNQRCVSDPAFNHLLERFQTLEIDGYTVGREEGEKDITIKTTDFKMEDQGAVIDGDQDIERVPYKAWFISADPEEDGEHIPVEESNVSSLNHIFPEFQYFYDLPCTCLSGDMSCDRPTRRSISSPAMSPCKDVGRPTHSLKSSFSVPDMKSLKANRIADTAHKQPNMILDEYITSVTKKEVLFPHSSSPTPDPQYKKPPAVDRYIHVHTCNNKGINIGCNYRP